jgi:hypothetical protein
MVSNVLLKKKLVQHLIHQYRISEKKTTPHATMRIHHSLF